MVEIRPHGDNGVSPLLSYFLFYHTFHGGRSTAGLFAYFFGSGLSVRNNSSNCFCATVLGALVIGQPARWVLGKR